MAKINELSAVYDELSENWTQTEKYKECIRKYADERDNLLLKIGKEYLTNIEEMCDNIFAAGSELSEEFFYKGFSLAVQILLQAFGNK